VAAANNRGEKTLTIPQCHIVSSNSKNSPTHASDKIKTQISSGESSKTLMTCIAVQHNKQWHISTSNLPQHTIVISDSMLCKWWLKQWLEELIVEAAAFGAAVQQTVTVATANDKKNIEINSSWENRTYPTCMWHAALGGGRAHWSYHWCHTDTYTVW